MVIKPSSSSRGSSRFLSNFGGIVFSHWERIKQYYPSLQLVLRFLGEAQSLCAKVGTLNNISILFIGPKLPISQSLI